MSVKYAILYDDAMLSTSWSFYKIDEDYYGFFPGENEKYSIRDFDKMNDLSGLVYFSYSNIQFTARCL